MPLPIYGLPDNGDIGGSPPTPPVFTSPVLSVNTRTGAVVLSAADVGLGNVNNTSDANKPISTATAAALATHSSQIATLQANGGGGSSEALLD